MALVCPPTMTPDDCATIITALCLIEEHGRDAREMIRSAIGCEIEAWQLSEAAAQLEEF
ncbi:hypothetical protein [Phenylobacterium sp.]|uniref:hypothetical protein n=1 Tax=Phenylobacterium sp. TaxID=1871053 RepID=UPI002737ED7B|nr:hypothetical protein [Phenylobacterium sp.]MDP3869940.1 hypothetical protein [Phenylobacterium sp.]